MTGFSGFMRRNRILQAYSCLIIVYLYFPIALLFLFSVNDSQYIVFPFKGLTLNWYRGMAGNAQLLESLLNSLRVGLVASVSATLLATLTAKAVARHQFRGRAAVVSFVSLPMVMPEIILGISLLIIVLGLGFDLSLTTVTLGHIVITTPYALAVMVARFSGYDPSYEEASLDLGETAFSTFWRVTLPLVWPGIVSSLLLTFLISFDDFVTSYFLTGTNQTLPVFIYTQLRFPEKLPSTLALGVSILAASIVLVVIAELLRRKGAETTQQGAIR
jgi:spermidine/putrescine transport system permease protein